MRKTAMLFPAPGSSRFYMSCRENLRAGLHGKYLEDRIKSMSKWKNLIPGFRAKNNSEQGMGIRTSQKQPGGQEGIIFWISKDGCP
jgi:hypothetical protein